MQKTLGQAANLFRAMAVALPQEVAKAELASAREARRLAITLSSGPYSSQALAVLGHPNSRTHPHPPRGRADIVNVQSGLFRDSWFIIQSGSVTAGNLTTILRNTAPYSYKMRGTFNMIQRPIDFTIAARIRPKRRARLEKALAKVLAMR